MTALKFITGHMVYNPTYNQILQTKEKQAIIWVRWVSQFYRRVQPERESWENAVFACLELCSLIWGRNSYDLWGDILDLP